MSEDPEGPVRQDDAAEPETSDTATTADSPVPPEDTSPDPEGPAQPDAGSLEPEAAAPESSEGATDAEPAAEPAEAFTPSEDPAPAADAFAPSEDPAPAAEAFVPSEDPAPPAETPAPPPAAEPGHAASSDALAKADVGKRIVAALIDFAIAFVMGLVPGVGQLLGAGYLILRDGLELDFMSHRSLGKQVMKLHLASVEGQPLELMTSVKRNWIFGIGPLVPLLFVIPILGWVLIPFALFAAIALGITELVLALTDADGRRLGDKWAATMVVED